MTERSTTFCSSLMVLLPFATAEACRIAAVERAGCSSGVVSGVTGWYYFSHPEVGRMPVRKRSYSLDERAAAYLDRTAKRVKRSASAVLTDLVAEAERQDARDRALEELGSGVDISDKDVRRWLKKLGAA